MSITSLLQRRGAPVLYHKERDTVPCPCRTREGFRDPIWHRDNPDAVQCNDAGFLFDAVELTCKAIIIPVWLSGGSRSSTLIHIRSLIEQFGSIQSDDHFGVFPLSVGGVDLVFENWSPAGEDWVQWAGKRFIAIAWTMIPDPHDTSQFHHHEVALRRINKDIPGVDFT